MSDRNQPFSNLYCVIVINYYQFIKLCNCTVISIMKICFLSQIYYKLIIILSKCNFNIICIKKLLIMIPIYHKIALYFSLLIPLIKMNANEFILWASNDHRNTTWIE